MVQRSDEYSKEASVNIAKMLLVQYSSEADFRGHNGKR